MIRNRNFSRLIICVFTSIICCSCPGISADDPVIVDKPEVEVENRNSDSKEADRLYFKAANLYLDGKYDDSKAVIGRILSMQPKHENALKLRQKIDDVARRLKENRSK